MSLRDALSLECEQRSIVMPEFPRVPGWFGSPSRHDLRVHRALLEVCREEVHVLVCLVDGTALIATRVPSRRGFARLSVIRGCVSSAALTHFSTERLFVCR